VARTGEVPAASRGRFQLTKQWEEASMRLARWSGRAAIAAVVVAEACGGGGSSTAPPGPPSQLVKSAGDAQSWYYNNPLPTPLSVTAEDASGQPVSGVVVTWAVASGGGGVSPTQSTTNASGVASTVDSVGSSTLQMVNATFSGLPGPVSFTENGATAPTAIGVSVQDNHFSPQGAVVKIGGIVTWSWTGSNPHNVTFSSGPTPRPRNGANMTTGTLADTIPVVGTYGYACTNHAGMSGTVTVVH
jgi:plastocyanin